MSHKLFDRGQWRKATKTPEGWLRAEGRLTRIGVFPYVLADGSLKRLLRLPEEVFHPDSLASFKMLPITNMHPPTKRGLLDAKTAKSHTVGNVGDSLVSDGEYLLGPLLVTDAKAVENVENGSRRELSCGYTCEWDETPGVWNGQPYDAIQRNIRGNHVALVDVGRAGPEVRVLLDAGDGIQALDDDNGEPPAPILDGGRTVKKMIGGVEVEVSEVASQAIDLEVASHTKTAKELKATADSVSAELAALKAEKEKLTAKADSLAADLEKSRKALTDAADPKATRARVEARLKLEAVAKKHLGDKVNLDASDKDLKVAVLEKVRPTITLDGKSDEYLAAAFEFANLDAADPEDDDTTEENDELAKVRKLATDRATNDGNASDPKRAAFLKKTRESYRLPLSHTVSK